MKVLLVNPPFPTKAQIMPPLGLGYIGAYLRKKGNEVRLVDMVKGNKDLLVELEIFRPDVVGITGLTTQYPNMRECARLAKGFGAVTIVGGNHASAIPEYILNDCGDIDMVVKGEGEYSLTQFLGESSPVSIPGFYYRKNGSVEGLSPEVIEDLGSLPHPWVFLELGDYDGNRINGILKCKGRQAVSIVSSRGCPYKCSFCSASQAHGKRVRVRPVEDIIGEMKELISEGIEEVQILDDNFTFYEEHAHSVCDAMIKEKLNLVWTLPNGIRADRVDFLLLSKMKEAGCYYFGVGIESGSEKMLKRMHKELSLPKAKEAIREADKLGFITQGFLLIGFPGETREDLDKTLHYVTSSRLDRISINQVMPYPGTELYENYFSSYGLDWKDLHRTVLGPSLPPSTKFFSRYLYLRFYLNPRRLLHHISKFKTWSQWQSLIGGLQILISEVRR